MVTCCNQDVSRSTSTLRNEFIQFQVHIVRVVEEEKPVPLALVCKPMETRIYGLLCISWSDGLKVCSK
ncbi:hypothetical protein AGABI1DRAFT_111824, partial [Agaricus bisporus var. burnettii JB137-S8]